MATVTAAINAQSVGTEATNVGNTKLAYKLTKQAASTVYIIEAKLVNGAGAIIDRRAPVDVNFVSSSLSIAAATAATQLKTVHTLKLYPGEAPGETAIYSTDAQTFKGDYVYVWVDLPTFNVAGTLTVNTIELP